MKLFFSYFFASSSGSNSNDSSMMNEISDVDVYFKRLYSKTTNPPPISVDDFLDIMAKCKDATIPRERVKSMNKINVFLLKCFFQLFF